MSQTSVKLNCANYNHMARHALGRTHDPSIHVKYGSPSTGLYQNTCYSIRLPMANKRKVEEMTPEPPTKAPGSATPSRSGRTGDWTDEEVKELCTLRQCGMAWE